jgi:hypothetical protein
VWRKFLLLGLVAAWALSGRVIDGFCEDKILAEGNGLVVRESEVGVLRERFSSRFQTTETEYCRALLRMKLFAKEAQATGLDKDPAFQARLDQLILQELSNLYMTNRLDAYPLSDEAIESYYRSHPDEFGGRDNLKPLDDQLKKAIKDKIMGIKRAQIVNKEMDRLMEKYNVKLLDPVCQKGGDAK